MYSVLYESESLSISRFTNNLKEKNHERSKTTNITVQAFSYHIKMNPSTDENMWSPEHTCSHIDYKEGAIFDMKLHISYSDNHAP